MGTFDFFRILLKKDSLSKKSNKSSTKSETTVESPTTSTTTSSTFNEYAEHGRRYHGRSDASYILPNDEEESDRVHMQHWIVKLAFSGNYDAPVGEALEEGDNVLDAGCGPATWPLEMSEMYPQSKFYGVDISLVFPTQIKPKNCEFSLHNLAEPLPFPDNYFRFVHQRLLVMGHLKADWPKILKEFIRVTKPGGWIELTECTMPDLANSGPKMNAIMASVNVIAKKKGLNPAVAYELKTLMEEAGAINVVDRRVVTPVGHGGKLGALLWEDFYSLFTTFRPIVAKSHPELEPPEAYDKFLKNAKDECSEYKTGFIWHRTYGQKPSF
ncbi:S-adenosyl-L-methionine-dependent methyltransferase [Circinella umbellata]|nr:S-adenosyl-L-methionine-dependent methyltransferase [Circinella umbellata]